MPARSERHRHSINAPASQPTSIIVRQVFLPLIIPPDTVIPIEPRPARRFVDLSVPLENDAGWAPWWARTRVVRRGHRVGAWVMRLLFGVGGGELRDGLGWANDHISLSTHGTTHLDAPWHYGPRCEGESAKTIDQVPLDWCYASGVKLDVRHLEEGRAVGVDDLKAALARIPHTVQPGEIVLIQTGNDRFWGQREYFTRGVGMSAAATRWIVEQGVKVAGIDSWGWDVPLPEAARAVKRGKGREPFWAAHYAGIDHEYCHLERLTNLDQLPAVGFTVCCFPLKVRGGSAGPARVVAILNERAA